MYPKIRRQIFPAAVSFSIVRLFFAIDFIKNYLFTSHPSDSEVVCSLNIQPFSFLFTFVVATDEVYFLKNSLNSVQTYTWKYPDELNKLDYFKIGS